MTKIETTIRAMTKEAKEKEIKILKNCIKEDKKEIKEFKKVKMMMFESPLTLIRQREKRIKKALYFIEKLKGTLRFA